LSAPYATDMSVMTYKGFYPMRCISLVEGI